MPSFETITLDSNFEVYAGIDTAIAYADGADHASSFRTLLDTDEDSAARKLITATRLFDRQRWRGEKVDANQDHAFPRKNTGLDEMEVVDFPADLQRAVIETAIALSNGSELQDQSNTSQRISSLSAGSVSLSFFAGVDGPIPKRFPQIVHELISKYLVGSTKVVSGVVSGADGESITNKTFGYSRGI